MLGLYAIALVPALIGVALYIFRKEVSWLEWLGCTAMAFAASGIMHGIALWGMTDDIETWSGRVVQVAHHPAWVEEYRQRHSETYYTGSGKNRQSHTRTWYTTEHDHHPEHWMADKNYGTYSDDQEISQAEYARIKAELGNTVVDGGKQGTHHGGHHDGGDNSIYSTPNTTRYIHPVTTTKHFENRVKAAPTLFSFAKVPPGTPVFPYPSSPSWDRSGRLLGAAVGSVDLTAFDQMNSRLGPTKKVNVIIVGFPGGDSSIGHWQEALWIGGRKNDLVLCYGTAPGNPKPTWAYCFGWTEKTDVKRSLETIAISSPVSTDMLKAIEAEVSRNYVIKDWKKFDYISIDPPRWAYITLIILMVLVQGGWWLWAFNNQFSKDGNSNSRFRYGKGF